MRATNVRVQNFRSFVDSGSLALGRINVLIGANNAGKSTILRAIHQIQHGAPDPYPDVRAGTSEAALGIQLSGVHRTPQWPAEHEVESFMASFQSSDRRSGSAKYAINWGSGGKGGDYRLEAIEPRHFIVPFYSKRKAVAYSEDIREQNVISVSSDAHTLAAKLSRLGNPAFPGHTAYAEACKSILGFVVTAVPSTNGQRPGIYLPDGQSLAIDQLGEGVPNVVQFLANLAVSEGKLFLVEEPENDLHPQALKALLDLVIESSTKNQFVISTHSNIVVRQLCSAADSRLYRVRQKSNALPTESEIEAVANTPSARLEVLAELGYSLSDFELWDGWLVLEESSAERIIRDYLIPWFAPKLSRIRTISASGAAKIGTVFEELHRLFVFAHLTPVYSTSCWVLADGDDEGRRAIEKLRTTFSNHASERFQQFSKPAFEYYYPENFHDKARAALAISNKDEKRKSKKDLLHEVMAWLDADQARGRGALQTSAAEVIQVLQQIQKSLDSKSSA